ncbi:peritrophin-48 [Stomoxys calcitrans]|uniref:peritrophin-48 n=1 Tax=Stomoxys calcitrans TaxID=35570 RepID=UPI0027E280AB|nr:peritrophin-48 [Stomoxys calcitrans]
MPQNMTPVFRRRSRTAILFSGNMKLGYLFVTLLLGILWQRSQATKWALESKEDVCSLFPDGAILRKPGSCQETIKCMNGVSTPGPTTCEGSQGYKLETNKCASVSDAYCSTPCVKNSPTWVAGKRNCIDWAQCDGKTQLSTGSCPTGQIFNAEVQRCQYKPTGFVCDMVYDICNISPKDQKFWDEFNCHKYFYCDKSQKQQTGECPTGTYYEKQSGECIAKAQVDCYKHPLPLDVCGNAKLAIRDHFVSDQATCSGYFYCKDLGSGIPDTNPDWGKCSNGYFFDAELEVCRDRNTIHCDEDRCDGRTSGFELAPIPGCQHYYQCENGYTIGPALECEEGLYFDAGMEKCVATKTSYPICS